MPRALLVNDDGPPSPSSPHVLGLYQLLIASGWDVRVVIPSGQHSWGGMAASLKPIAQWYYYPLKDNFTGEAAGTADSWSAERRPLRKGEIGEWVLCDASPTACTNIGLFNSSTLFPDDVDAKPFDVVLSGPNFGRNTGSAFAMASGTVGAALAGAIAGFRSISLSYGHFTTLPPALEAALALEPAVPAPSAEAVKEATQPETTALAHQLVLKIAEKLLGEWEEGVGTYAVNVPLGYTLRDPTIVWTKIWQNTYGQLYRPLREPQGANSDLPNQTKALHPHSPADAPTPTSRLHFAPRMSSMLQPPLEELPEGTDIWAIMNGFVSVTRLEPNFAQPKISEAASLSAASQAATAPGQKWRL